MNATSISEPEDANGHDRSSESRCRKVLGEIGSLSLSCGVSDRSLKPCTLLKMHAAGCRVPILRPHCRSMFISVHSVHSGAGRTGKALLACKRRERGCDTRGRDAWLKAHFTRHASDASNPFTRRAALRSRDEKRAAGNAHANSQHLRRAQRNTRPAARTRASERVLFRPGWNAKARRG